MKKATDMIKEMMDKMKSDIEDTGKCPVCGNKMDKGDEDGC